MRNFIRSFCLNFYQLVNCIYEFIDYNLRRGYITFVEIKSYVEKNES